METAKKYKTISILVGLIIVFGILTVFVKVFDIGGVKATTLIKVALTPTPTVSDPFIHPESLNIPSSYIGYSITKSSQAELGMSALKYGNRNIDLTGFEWTIKKSKVSDVEYTQIKSLIDATIQGQLVNKGWKKTLKFNGQELTPSFLNLNNLGSGYVVASGGKFQEVIFEGNRDSSDNIVLKLFLSKIYNLKNL